ncbi:hypothetical protein EBT16_03345 [bacterium]|nr:hypothetical protein [bacterium]
MAISNKDGSVYVIKSPNPLVKEQEKWDSSKLVFHNFTWDEIRSNAAPRMKRQEPKRIADLPPPIPEPIPAPKQETCERENLKTNETPNRQQEDKTFDLPHIKYKVISHCLPAIVQKKKDSLYGESWERLSYGRKMVFPLIVVESNDFSFDFWTSDPNEQITERSIIYPFSYEVYNEETGSYDRVPYDEYRWWKVISKERKEGGWLFKSVPSETQPDFSE